MRRFSALSMQAVTHYNNEILPAVAALRSDAVEIVDLDEHICAGGDFRMTMPAAQARRDGLHFSKAASLEIARWLGPIILDAARRGTSPSAAP